LNDFFYYRLGGFMSCLFPDDCAFFLLTRGSLSIKSVFKKILVKYDLPEIKPSYLGVLICLWETAAMDEVLGKFGNKEGMKLTDLGRCAGVEPSTITGLVDRMERDGLVYRMPVYGDRRAQQAVLTDKARAIQTSVRSALDALDKEIFAGFSPTDLENAKQILRKIIENANKNKQEK
jgi:DNA-binding MarR family transcriptional regulator